MVRDFAHLHLHTLYSTLDGSNRPKELAKYIKSLGMSSVAITDHGVMGGCVEFYKACKKEGVKPILGMEGYVTDDQDDLPKELRKKDNYHLVLVAMNREGYENLLWMASNAALHNFYYRPRISKEVLASHSSGIIATSACFIPGTLVKTRRGWKPIECIESHDLLYSRFDTLQEVRESTTRKFSGNLITIKAKRWFLPITSTSDHQYFAIKNSAPLRTSNIPTQRKSTFSQKPTWIRAEDLRIGDWLLCPIPSQETGVVPDDWFEPIESITSARKHLGKFPINTETAELLGWFAAEGSTNRGRICFTFSSKEITVAERLSQILERHLGLKSKIFYRGSRCDLVTNSVELEAFLNSFIGKGAASKKIPELILRAQPSIFISFLRGLCYGDGSFSGKKFTIGTISKELTFGVIQAIARLGLVPSSWISIAHGIHKEAYYVQLGRKQASIFRSILETNNLISIPNPKDHSLEGSSYFIDFAGQRYLPAQIKSTTSTKVENIDVFCASMNGDPSFIANGFGVHNCLGNECNRRASWDRGTACYSDPGEAVEKAALFYREVFGGRYFLEIQDNPDEEGQQPAYNSFIIGLGKKLDIPIVITSDAHYMKKEDKEAHDLIMAMQTKKTLAEYQSPGNDFKYGPWFYVRSGDEMWEAANKYGCPESFDNTLLISSQCNVDLELGKYKPPVYDVSSVEDLDEFNTWLANRHQEDEDEHKTQGN